MVWCFVEPELVELAQVKKSRLVFSNFVQSDWLHWVESYSTTSDKRAANGRVTSNWSNKLGAAFHRETLPRLSKRSNIEK